MIAYNSTSLENLFIHNEVDTACDEGGIAAAEKDIIKANFPVKFYTPNSLIRIGLFILTIIIIAFSLGLLALIFLSVIEDFAGGLAIITALIGFGMLEFFIRRKYHFKSGVDDGLLWGSATLLVCGICLPNNFADVAVCMIILFVALTSALRYADRGMAATAFIALLGLIFLFLSKADQSFKAFLPFFIMGISSAGYLLSKSLNKRDVFNVYSDCLLLVEAMALFALYAAGNYAVVRELTNHMFNLNLAEGQSIPYGFIFWVFTIFIPLIYIFAGIQKKDRVLIRVGLILIAFLVYTVRLYHEILSVEMLMAVSGVVLIAIAWSLSRYLEIPKKGFTAEESLTDKVKSKLESLIIAETFSPDAPAPDGPRFGGGSFGGGGASGEF